MKDKCSYLPSKIFIKLFSIVAANSSYIVYISKWLKNKYLLSEVSEVLKNKNFKIIHHAPNKFFKTNDPKKENTTSNKIVFGYAGTLHFKQKVKGVLLLIDAINELKKINDDFILYMAGRGSLETKIRSKIEEYHLEEYVKFVGYLGKEDLKELYTNADYIIHSSFLDACPTSVLEAQACNTPVITIGDSGASELIDRKYCFDLGIVDKNEIAKFLFEIIKKGKTRDIIINLPFSWEKTANMFEEVFRELGVGDNVHQPERLSHNCF